MGKKIEEVHPSNTTGVNLHRRTEDRLRDGAEQSSPDPGAMAPEKILQMIHELQVHQIELEMQNEELRRVQGELTAERERYFDLYDTAPVGYMTLSSEGLILEVNLTVSALLGIPRSAMMNMPVSRYIFSEDQDTYYLHHRGLMKTKESQEFELRLVKNDGSVFWARVKIVAAKDPQGHSVSRMVVSDITLYKAAEEALNKRKEEAAAVISAKSRLAVLQSQIQPHFLYNALSAIIALCYTDGAKAGALLTTFSRFLRIVFSTDTEEETVPLHRELELVEAYTTIEEARYGERLHTVFNVDETLMEEKVMPLVLQPLVENAIRHGLAQRPEGGIVRLRIRRSRSLLKVTVCDNGVGMSRDRVHDILERQDTVAGVGIANINQRLHLHTGRKLRIRSAEGVGTVIVLYLPLKNDDPEVLGLQNR